MICFDDQNEHKTLPKKQITYKTSMSHVQVTSDFNKSNLLSTLGDTALKTNKAEVLKY